jgi:hypothetical protein
MSNDKHDRDIAKQIAQYRVPPEVTSEAVTSYLESLGCARALTVYMLYQYGEHEQLAELKFDPLHYLTVEQLRDAYAATALMSKADFLELGYDLDVRALEKFETFEFSCMFTNIGFRNLACDLLYKGKAVWLHNAIIRKIDQVLGDIPFRDLPYTANWGPGASTRIPRRYACATNKFQYETGITRDLLALFPPEDLEGFYPLWFKDRALRDFKLIVEAGNKVTTVPKDATKNRVIAIEPGFNLWFQKAVGTIMKKRLYRFGVDLSSQAVNQELARVGSLTLNLATIDFSSASDSIALEAVRAVFPPLWFNLFDACRSHSGVLSGKRVRWEKFSSMGNGFTFELETLFFLAIAVCVCEYLHIRPILGQNVNVYGDDVIIPTETVGLFSEMCLFYGFKLNMKKSHYSSCFRESCGKHYVSGLEVTPIYLKSRLSTVPAVFRFANAVRRLAFQRGTDELGVVCCDVRLKKTFDYLVKSIPRPLRLRIDEKLGDGGIVSNWDEAVPMRDKANQSGWLVKHVVDEGKTFKSGVLGLLLGHLWALERSSLKTSCFRSHALPSELFVARRHTWRIRDNPKGVTERETEQNLVFSSTWLRADLHPLLVARRSDEISAMCGGDRAETNNDVSLTGKTKMKMSLGRVMQWTNLGPWL